MAFCLYFLGSHYFSVFSPAIVFHLQEMALCSCRRRHSVCRETVISRVFCVHVSSAARRENILRCLNKMYLLMMVGSWTLFSSSPVQLSPSRWMCVCACKLFEEKSSILMVCVCAWCASASPVSAESLRWIRNGEYLALLSCADRRIWFLACY